MSLAGLRPARSISHGGRGRGRERETGALVARLPRLPTALSSPSASPSAWSAAQRHATPSYLPDARAYDNALVFARPRGARESVALLPDPYQMAGYGDLVERASRDPVPWERKRDVVFFAGTTTGDRDPARNERIRACVWSLSRPAGEAFLRITNVAQMTPEACRAAVPRFDEVLHRPVAVHEHFDFKYQLNIAGNTCCWSRVPMVLASGCLLMHLRTHADALWYYPLLREDEHYVAAPSIEAIPECRRRCVAQDAWCKEVAARGRRFREAYLTRGAAARYAAELLQEAAWLAKA